MSVEVAEDWLRWRFQYPMLSCIQLRRYSDQLFLRAEENLRRGLLVESDMSGTGGSHAALDFLMKALYHRNQFVTPSVRHYRASDVTWESLRVLSASSADTYEIEHVFRDLHSRLPEKIINGLHALEPAESDSPEVRRAAYKGMIAYLRDRLAEAFPDDATSPCVKCSPEPLSRKVEWRGLTPSVRCRVASPMPPGYPEWDHVNSDFEFTERPWVMNCTSTDCQPFSPMGHHQGDCDARMKNLVVWGAEQRHRRKDILWHEMVHTGQPELLDTVIGDSNDGFIRITVRSTPSTKGWGATRLRDLSAILNAESVVWVGPSTNQLIQKEFEDIFATTYEDMPLPHPCGVADAFFLCAPFECKLDLYKELARRRGLFIPEWRCADGSALNAHLEKILPPGQRQNLIKQREQYERKFFGVGPMYCDLEQNAGSKGDKASRELGAFLRHGSPYSMESEEILTGWGRLAAMGFPLPPFDSTFKVPFAAVLHELDSRHVIRLTGNAFHVHCDLAFKLYFTANVARREWPRVSKPVLHVSSDEESDGKGNSRQARSLRLRRSRSRGRKSG